MTQRWTRSPPSRRSGLKSVTLLTSGKIYCVSALAAEWIEIQTSEASFCGEDVSALAAEWIEITIWARKS